MGFFIYLCAIPFYTTFEGEIVAKWFELGLGETKIIFLVPYYEIYV